MTQIELIGRLLMLGDEGFTFGELDRARGTETCEAPEHLNIVRLEDDGLVVCFDPRRYCLTSKAKEMFKQGE